MEESNITRDYIALEAMKVIMQKTVTANPNIFRKIGAMFGLCSSEFEYYDESIAETAYDIADAMIAEREKRNKGKEGQQ